MTSIFVRERYLFLDSDSDKCIKRENGLYDFEISPPIQATGLEKNYIFLKSFSALNSIHNIRFDDNLVVTKIDYNGNPSGTITDFERTLIEQNIPDLEVLCEVLNEKFCPKSGSSIVDDITDSHDFDKPVPYLKFIFDKATHKVSATSFPHDSNIRFELSGKIFDMIHMKTIVGGERTIVSSKPVDVYRDQHSLFVTCNQITNSHINSANDIPNRLSKITLNNFGKYLQFEQQKPVQIYDLEHQNVNKLTFTLYDDSATIWKPDRFFLTLVITQHKPVVNHSPNYFVKDTTNSLIKESHESRKPPIRHHAPNIRCPQ